MNGNFWKWTIITEMLQLLQVGRGNSTSLYKSPKNVLACKASELCFVQYQRIMGVMEREHRLWVLNRKTTRGHVASTWRRPCGQMDLQSARFLVFPSWLDAFIKEKKNKYFSAEIGCWLLLHSVFYLTFSWFSFRSVRFTQIKTCCSSDAFLLTRGRVILIPPLIYYVTTRSQCYGIWMLVGERGWSSILSLEKHFWKRSLQYVWVNTTGNDPSYVWSHLVVLIWS